MLRVTVELISARHPSRNRQLGIVEISNIGGTKTKAKYRYKVMGKDGRVMDIGTVADIPRKQFHAMDLLTICMTAARGQKMLRKLNRE